MGAAERREGIANGTIKTYPTRGQPTKYTPAHCDDLIEKMAQGMLDVEIYASWNISKSTFYTWRKENEEFNEAWQIGYAKCEAYYIKKSRERIEAGDDAGFKYYIGLMNNKFGWGKGEGQAGSVTTNNIQIGNMNVLSTKSDSELLEILNQKLSILRINPELPILDADSIDDDES